MLVIVGLILLIAAVVVVVAAVSANSADEHILPREFEVLGIDITGSTGELFLYGAAVGAVAMLGLALLVAGMRRPARRVTAPTESA
ncbi:hypothetical protein [Rhodococcus spongiicola]|uniref:Uncharacterized protein n=1 Tax=Rhodococcus spongiicola TaxID=2487352 RepID=A0A438B600_9NOCA|nr:hypothetical protein [Rhodococcus spongiicola]RVW06391.1 hypothetical protein EF834_02900 [Rhodococcus spongiicola]